MYILGISAYYHDSAAVLLKDGRIVCGMEEERFTRIKHDNGFPVQAVRFCLETAGVSINEVSIVSFYEKPLLKFERILDMFMDTYPRSLIPFVKSMPEWLGKKIQVEQTIRKTLGFTGKVVFVPHHLSHAAAAFLQSPFRDAAILTVDGVGEYRTTGLWHGKNTTITPLRHIDFPHSIGLLYSTFTSFLGFKVNEDEFKVMGLAAYGKPVYAGKIKRLVDLKKDGSFALDTDYFSFREEFRMWNGKFETLFGTPRKPGALLTARHQNLAASIQAVTEEAYFAMLTHLHQLTGAPDVCISGGVGLNALANGKIYRKTPFKRAFVFGAAGDNGAALGCAAFAYYHMFPDASRAKPARILTFGTEYKNETIEKILIAHGLPYRKMSDAALIRETAQLLARGKVVGWFQGKAEFGPRALGNRSILCKPAPFGMKRRMNIIKRRESFRPFAGSILQDHVHEYFEVPEKKHSSPFMVFCFPVRKEKRGELAAIVHKDKTCRIQTVNRENGRYYDLIREFYRLTGTASILNTSFNVMGEPIVETPEQAVEDFLKNRIDHLAIGSFLVSK